MTTTTEETMETYTYTNTDTGKRWGYTRNGNLWCDECDGDLMVTVAPHEWIEDYDCDGPDAHRHTCQTCEC